MLCERCQAQKATSHVAPCLGHVRNRRLHREGKPTGGGRGGRRGRREEWGVTASWDEGTFWD